MKKTLVVAARELRERWLFLPAALALGCIPLVLPAFGVSPQDSPGFGLAIALMLGGAAALVQCKLLTGRTHQIRVHMAYIRHPVFGDPVYGGRLQLPPRANDELKGLMRNFGRQALHARRLGLVHPVSERPMQWEAPLPPDMAPVLRSETKGQVPKIAGWPGTIRLT